MKNNPVQNVRSVLEEQPWWVRKEGGGSGGKRPKHNNRLETNEQD